MHRERTYIMVKPDGIQKRRIGEIISRFETVGLKMVACKMMVSTKEIIEKHYADDEDWYISSGTRTIEGYEKKGIKIDMTPREVGMKTRGKLINYFIDRPVVAMVWEGPHAVQIGRKLAGHTNPLAAELGSIRGDLSGDSYEFSDLLDRSIVNYVHASGTPEEAEAEIKVWLNKDDILDYDMVDQEIMMGKDWGRVKK